MTLPTISPIARLSLGLTSLMVSFVILLGVLIVIPDGKDESDAARHRLSESLGMQVAVMLQRGDPTDLRYLLAALKSHTPDLQSLAVRKIDGTLVTQVGEHALHWQGHAEDLGDLNNIRVPLLANLQPWGSLELSFDPEKPTTRAAWLGHQWVVILLLLGWGGFIGFYLFLRRALFYLDPTSAVPERVRRAFDSLREGILILDRSGRIMLANSAFQRLHPGAQEELVGRAIDRQEWLLDGLRWESEVQPWTEVINEGKEFEDVLLDLTQPNGDTVHTLVNFSPVHAPNGAVRGCLISIDNVSELYRANEKLLELVGELNATRDEIEQKNKELNSLVSRDPLTGCFNRRFMFEYLEERFVEAQSEGSTFSCIMADIDHFKNFNDRYGHAVGDEVIRATVRAMQSGLRVNDMLFRYGGEEFCVVLPETSLAEAGQVAERLRESVELYAGKSVRSNDVTITSSFGVAGLDGSMLDPAELVGRADEALYQAKNQGRNRVILWQANTKAAV